MPADQTHYVQYHMQLFKFHSTEKKIFFLGKMPNTKKINTDGGQEDHVSPTLLKC